MPTDKITTKFFCERDSHKTSMTNFNAAARERVSARSGAMSISRRRSLRARLYSFTSFILPLINIFFYFYYYFHFASNALQRINYTIHIYVRPFIGNIYINCRSLYTYILACWANLRGTHIYILCANVMYVWLQKCGSCAYTLSREVISQSTAGNFFFLLFAHNRFFLEKYYFVVYMGTNSHCNYIYPVIPRRKTNCCQIDYLNVLRVIECAVKCASSGAGKCNLTSCYNARSHHAIYIENALAANWRHNFIAKAQYAKDSHFAWRVCVHKINHLSYIHPTARKGSPDAQQETRAERSPQINHLSLFLSLLQSYYIYLFKSPFILYSTIVWCVPFNIFYWKKNKLMLLFFFFLLQSFSQKTGVSEWHWNK